VRKSFVQFLSHTQVHTHIPKRIHSALEVLRKKYLLKRGKEKTCLSKRFSAITRAIGVSQIRKKWVETEFLIVTKSAQCGLVQYFSFFPPFFVVFSLFFLSKLAIKKNSLTDTLL